MLPLFIVFLMIVLWLAASATNLTALALQRQRLQAEADQTVLSNYKSNFLGVGETAELERCATFDLPIKLIGLPASHQICVRSAAR